MKKFKMFLLAAAITFSGAVLASENPTKKTESNSVSESVGELLKNPEFELNQNVDALVSIFINDKDEIVVLSVDTENEAVERYIKYRLNYKKLSKDVFGKSKSFKVPVKMLKS
jgi:hypothetical protein